jgi:hypothetical protein
MTSIITNLLDVTCKVTKKTYKYLTDTNNEDDETATGQMNDTVSRQQAQEDQRPTPHKHRRSERQEGQTVVTAEAIGVRDEDKRGSEDRGKGNREHQFQTQPVIVDDRQKRKSDAQEQQDRRIKEMERNMDAQRRQITGLTQERKLLQEDVKRTEGSLIRSEQERRKLQSEIEDLRDRLAQSQRHVHTFQQQLQRQEQENKILQTESHGLKDQYAHTVTLLETRTSELKGAQAFLTKADSLSGAEVTSMVEGLNSEILQTAAFMADSFKFAGTLASAAQERHEACERVEYMLGKRISVMLSSVQHSEDPMLVQIALQSCLVWHCGCFIRQWSWELDNSGAVQLLENIYARVRKAGEKYDC